MPPVPFHCFHCIALQAVCQEGEAHAFQTEAQLVTDPFGGDLWPVSVALAAYELPEDYLGSTQLFRGA